MKTLTRIIPERVCKTCHAGLATTRWMVRTATLLFATLPALAQTTPTTHDPTPIRLDQLGTVAGKQYQGDALGITATTDGALLRCGFQKLDGQATAGGLWLESTAPGATGKLRLVATVLGRAEMVGSSRCDDRTAQRAVPTTRLSPTGVVSVSNQCVRFVRPGVTEEYSVGVDGVRQDFVIESRPLNSPLSTLNPAAGDLRLELALTGAQAEATAYGVKLTMDGSGRELAYGRLRATDATGKELTARLEVMGSFHDSRTAPRGLEPFAERSADSHVRQFLRTGSRGQSCPRSGQRFMGSAAAPAAPVNASLTGQTHGSDLGLDAGWILAEGFDEGVEPDTRGACAPRLVVLVDDAEATYPIRIDPTFSDADWVSLNPGLPGADKTVQALAADGSGNLYVGGAFTFIGTVQANYIAKWDGSTWSALGPGMDGTVYALAVSGNDLYVGGSFTSAGGITVNGIAKWNGSTWSALGSGIGRADSYSPSVYALAVNGTDLYAGGYFTTAGGVSANYIAKWNGSNWSALGLGMNSSIRALAVIGTDLYAGGSFTTAGGITVNQIAKWNGSTWSALGSGMSSTVYALAVNGTDLYAGGWFTTAGGITVNHIAKWNGSTWSSLGSGVDSWGEVHALAVSGTDLYAGGYFSTAGGVPANSIAKWNGSTWSALGSGMNDIVYALAVSGTSLYAGGEFRTAGEVTATRIAKWNGSTWSALGSGMDSSVRALAVIGTNLYAGGYFTTVGGVTVNRIAKWNGSSWSGLGTGMGGNVEALALSGTDLYALGGFATAGGVTVNGVAKWNGSAWSALGSGQYGNALAVISGTNLYAGFDAGQDTSICAAKWDGSTWSALGGVWEGHVFVPMVKALAVSGTDLYAGGCFEAAGGVPANHIAKWNGSTWSALGSGIGGLTFPVLPVYALAVSGTNLYAGGRFTTAGGVTVNNIAKWNGSTWSALGPGVDGIVYALAVSGTDLYVGGDFTTAGGVAATNIAKWNGSTWSGLGSGTDGRVYVLAADGSGHLFVGGSFYLAGGKVSPYIAQANLLGTPTVLGATFSGNAMLLSWPNVDPDWRLEFTTNLASGGVWTEIPPPYSTNAGNLQFTEPLPAGNKFYRLRKP